MAYTTGDLVTRVQQRIRDTGYSSSEIKSYLNDTLNDVFNEYRLPFVQATQNYTLTADDPDVTSGSGLPSNYVQALNLILTTTGREKVLLYRDVREMDTLYPSYQSSSLYPANVPNEWYYFEQTINVFPKPNSAYTVTLQYYKKPTELVSDSDVPELPSEFAELLVVGAAFRVLQVKDNYDQAAIFQNKYDELLQKLVVKYSQPQVGAVTRMRINRHAVGKTRF